MARRYDLTVWIASSRVVVLSGVVLSFHWLPASKLAHSPGPLGGIAGLFLRDSRVCIVKYLCNYVCRACFQNQKFFPKVHKKVL
jgi:hypothetical protein